MSTNRQEPGFEQHHDFKINKQMLNSPASKPTQIQEVIFYVLHCLLKTFNTKTLKSQRRAANQLCANY